MKKVLTAAAVLVVLILTLTACGKTDAAKAVIEQIKAVVANVTADSGEELESVRHEYDLLSDKEKKQVGKVINKLDKAAELYESIATMNSDIAAIVRDASAEYSSDNFAPTEMIARAEEIKEDYKKLSDDTKAQIADYDKLDEAVEKMKTYVANAEKVAKEYVAAFKKTHKNAEILEIYCLKQIRDGGAECHVFAMKFKEGGEEKTVYSNSRFRLGVTAADIEKVTDTAFAQKAMSDNYNAELHNNVTLDLKNVL